MTDSKKKKLKAKQDQKSGSWLLSKLADLDVWGGLAKMMILFCAITLLGLTGTLKAIVTETNSATSLSSSTTTDGESYIDISTSTGSTGTVALVTAVISPVITTIMFFSDHIFGDDNFKALTTAQYITEATQFALWITSGVKYSVNYGSWDCYDVESLLDQYSETDYENITSEFDDAYTFEDSMYNNDAALFELTNITNTTLLDDLNEGIGDFFTVFNVTEFTISGLDLDTYIENQNLIAKLSKDCQLKKGAMGVSWCGVGFYVIFIVVYLLSYLRSEKAVDPDKTPVPVVIDYIGSKLGGGATRPSTAGSSSSTFVSSLGTDHSTLRIPSGNKVTYCVTTAIYEDSGDFTMVYTVNFSGYEKLFYWEVTCTYDATRGFLKTDVKVIKVDSTSKEPQSFSANIPLDSVIVKFECKERNQNQSRSAEQSSSDQVRKENSLTTVAEQNSSDQVKLAIYVGKFITWVKTTFSTTSKPTETSRYNFSTFGCMQMTIELKTKTAGREELRNLAEVLVSGHDSSKKLVNPAEQQGSATMRTSGSTLVDNGEDRYVLSRGFLHPRRMRVY